MKTLILFTIIAVGNGLMAQYNIATDNGNVITACSGSFVDAGGAAGDYTPGEQYEITFCSDNGAYLYFDFMNVNTSATIDLGAGDTLFVYDGYGTTGELIDVIDMTYNASSNDYTYTQSSNSEVYQPFFTSTCVTFLFKSDANSQGAGWYADFSCKAPIPGCNGNLAPSDVMRQAPLICNLNGYCGQSSADYSSDLPYAMGDNGSCANNDPFAGNVNNNSWLSFIAGASDVTLNFEVSNCTGSRGLQTAILQPNDLGEMINYSQCAMSESPGLQGTFDLVGSNLVIGERYYLMIDGSNTTVCDYVITVDSALIVQAVEDTLICVDDLNTELSVDGPAGAIYTWTSSDPSFGSQQGSSIWVSPDVNTTYYVEVTGGNSCVGSLDEVLVSVEDCSVIDTSSNNSSDTLVTVVLDSEQIYLPNVFSPNGDGQNDLFWVTSELASEINVQIFNRWGGEIVSFDGKNRAWNGKNAAGIAMEEGVYYCIVKCTWSNGEEKVYYHHVSLFR